MTYFHRRTSTIIGAKAFHGPVRDGKAWDHLAMVVKRKAGVSLRRAHRHHATKPIWEEAPPRTAATHYHVSRTARVGPTMITALVLCCHCLRPNSGSDSNPCL